MSLQWISLDLGYEFPHELPLEEPVLVFALALLVFLTGPLIIKRLGQPGIVGIVLAGVAIGPNALGLIAHTDAIVLLGEVGLIYLLFVVGVELDLNGFFRAPEKAATFGLTSFGIPFLVGTGAAHVVLGLDLWAAALLAAVFASHTLLAYPIVNRLGVTTNRAVTDVFGGILFTDTLALVVLALAMGGAEGGFSPALVLEVGLSLALLFGLTWFVVPPVARWFFQNLNEESYFEFLFVLAAFFLAASLAEVVNVAPILGAFVAGLALNRLIPDGGTLMNRIEFVGNALFIPFFLLHVGMLVDPAVILDGPRTLQVAGVIVGVLVVTKFVASWLVANYQGYGAAERDVMFGLSVGQAAAALAITLVGLEAGIFTEHVLNAVVLMVLVTAVLSPFITGRAARELALSAGPGPAEGEELDPTILLPLSRTAEHGRRLLDLALVMKAELVDDPVHLMTVVQPQHARAQEEAIATARDDLEPLAEHGRGAEVRVETEIRVNHNVSSAILNAAAEVEAEAILMGWDAAAPISHRMFGSIIDRVLERTTLPVYVSRLGHPVNTTNRLWIAVPAGIDRQEGFFEAVHAVKRLAANLGVPITVVVIDGSVEQYQELFGMVEGDVTADFERADGWVSFVSDLRERCDENDLIVALSPRRGEVSWTNDLRHLPRRLNSLPPASFVVVHPRQGEPEYDRRFLRMR